MSSTYLEGTECFSEALLKGFSTEELRDSTNQSAALSCRETSSASCFHLTQFSPSCSPSYVSLWSSQISQLTPAVYQFCVWCFFSAFQSSLVYLSTHSVSSSVPKYWDERLHPLCCCTACRSLSQAGSKAAGKVLLSWHIPLEVTLSGNSTPQISGVWISTARGVTDLLLGHSRADLWRSCNQCTPSSDSSAHE